MRFKNSPKQALKVSTPSLRRSVYSSIIRPMLEYAVLFGIDKFKPILKI